MGWVQEGCRGRDGFKMDTEGGMGSGSTGKIRVLKNSCIKVAVLLNF